MDNIEQLKQDNAKLNERLNNAAKFFREQKAQIEALTKENEELKRTPKEEVIDTEKWNALVTEKENLNKQCNEYELKLQAAEEKAEMWQKNLRSVENTTNEEVKKVTIARDEWIEKYRNLEKNIESKDKAYQNLQNTYNEVFADYNKLKVQITQIDEYKKSIDHLQNTLKSYEHKIDELENNNPEVQKLEEQLVKAEKIIDTNKLDYNNLKKDNENLQKKLNVTVDESNKIEKAFNEYKKETDNLQNTYKNTVESLNKVTNENKELQDKYNNLEKICNDFENQKLAADADYQGALDMYQELQKEYERLRNERDIYSQSDDTLAEIAKILIDKGLVNKNDITPQSKIKESGTAHRMGDSLESGKNVGV